MNIQEIEKRLKQLECRIENHKWGRWIYHTTEGSKTCSYCGKKIFFGSVQDCIRDEIQYLEDRLVSLKATLSTKD